MLGAEAPTELSAFQRKQLLSPEKSYLFLFPVFGVCGGRGNLKAENFSNILFRVSYVNNQLANWNSVGPFEGRPWSFL